MEIGRALDLAQSVIGEMDGAHHVNCLGAVQVVGRIGALHELHDHALQLGLPAPVVGVRRQVDLLPVLPLLDGERADADGVLRPGLAVLLDQVARHDIGDRVGKLVQDHGFRLVQGDLNLIRADGFDALDRLGLLVGHVAAAHDVAEIVVGRARGEVRAERAVEGPDHVVGADRRAVAELQALAQGKGIGLAAVADLPGRRGIGLDVQFVVDAHQSAEDQALHQITLGVAGVGRRRVDGRQVVLTFIGHAQNAVGSMAGRGVNAAHAMRAGHEGADQPDNQN